MKIAIITLDAFNELDSFIASAILNRVNLPDWEVQICCPTDQVTSMNGVRIEAQQPIEYANTADIVLFGSGMKTLEYANDASFLKRLSLDPTKQLIGSQCSGALFLQRLGLLENTISTDTLTAPKLLEVGMEVADQPLYAEGNIASTGGCLSSYYLAAWMITKATNWQTAADIIHYVAPVGQKEMYVEMTKGALADYL
ncbi:AraC family transcriptional regulator [Sneathiella sp. P13V-1]|uniref:DJ-1/PfpI family protein n=1 Tax=Sneathiella sp. P13V-1 TaxID=2697366 RepID=UPI00187B87E9|nr:DJ-1/PfpI family protein [Sneathiella sp. P13V-1]MBE7637121.1 AraC family transcriptional regulator [Sneathiella sp. P13V-1]